MNRVILFFVVIALFVGSLLSGYFYIRTVKREVNPAIIAVPATAAAIFETENFWKDWKKQSSTSLIFKELRSFPSFARFDSTFVFLDSALAQKEPFNSLQKQSPILISFIRSGVKDIDLLYSISIPADAQTETLLSSLKNQLGFSFSESSKEYDGATIYSLKAKEFVGYYTLYKDVLSFSTNQLLIEDAVRQLNAETNILNDESFASVFETKGKGNQGHWFINTAEFLDFSFEGLKNKPADQAEESFSNWMAFDMKTKPNALLFNGFVHCFDSTQQFLNRFEGQSAQEVEIVDYLPANTAFLYQIGVSNFQDYYKALENEASSSTFSRNKALGTLKDSLGADLIDGFKTLTQNELGVFIVEPVLGDVPRNSFAFFKSQNIEESVKLLWQYSSERDTLTVDDQNYSIGKINYPTLVKDVFGAPFGLITEHYFGRFDNYLFFTNNKRSLTDLFFTIASGKTLAKDLNFDNYQEYLSDESNVFCYLNLARSPNLFSQFASSDLTDFFAKNETVFRQFEGLSFQISSTGTELYYANVILNHNPEYKQATGTLWELSLDTGLARAPFIFINHYTNAKELFVQDLSNKIYLISNTGKVIWERQLDEPIYGQVYMVDVYKNEKYQLLFNTKNFVYLIDRKGRDVESYPVKPNSSIVGSIKLIDYDRDKDYRILIPLTGGKLENRNIYGKEVKGWEFKKRAKNIAQIKYFQQNKKDFIVLFFDDGSLDLLNRRGESRWKIKGTLPVSLNGFYIAENKDLKNICFYASDSLGNIYGLTMADKQKVTTADDFFEEEPAYNYFEVGAEKSGYHLLTGNDYLILQNESFETIFEQKFPDAKLYAPQVFISPDQSIIIALIDREENRVFLINQFGLISEDYPFTGSSQVVIDDLNEDGTQNLIVSAKDGTLLMYSIRQ